MRRLILFVFCLFYMLSAFSQEGEEIDSPMVSSALVTEKESINPVIVTAHSAQNLQWDSTGSVFSYQEDDTIVLRSSQFPFLHFANIELEGVQDYSLYHEVDSGIQLIAGASDGTVAVWSVPISPPPSSTNNAAELNTTELLPDFINNATNGRPVNVLVFSEDGNYLAEHFSDTGELGMHFRLRYTSELVSRQIVGEPLPVYSMVFSHDKELLAVAGTDGTIRIWSSFTGKLVRELKQYPESRVPIHFISDTYNVLVASSPWELVVLDPLGAELSKIQAKSSILNVAITSDKKHVAVLTEENRLELYDLGTGEYVGYVPSFNVTAMTSFDFNHDDSQLLMGHQDGSVYMVDVKKVLTVPRKKPVLRLITEEEVVEKGVEFTDRIPLVEYKDSVVDGGHVRHIPEDVFTSPRHSIDMLVGTTFLPDPFTLSLDAQLGYSNSFLLHPFSFGLSWRSSWGFPEAPFPYIYHHGAIEYDPPLLISWVLEVPLGLSFSPWGSGLEIHTEVALGFAVHELWNRRMGAQAVTAGIHSKDFHGSFVTALTMGVAWKGITLKFSGEWDSELGWTGQVVLGYSFNLPVPQKYRRENSLQKVAVEPERNDVAEMEMLP